MSSYVWSSKLLTIEQKGREYGCHNHLRPEQKDGGWSFWHVIGQDRQKKDCQQHGERKRREYSSHL